MMKDKKILTEINRIKEIMGVRLLTEQPQVFDNILTSLVKLSKGGLKSKITKFDGLILWRSLQKAFDVNQMLGE